MSKQAIFDRLPEPRSGVSLHDIDGQPVVLNANSQKLHRVSKLTAEVWKHIEYQSIMEKIEEMLQTDFDVPLHQVQAVIRGTLEELEALEVLGNFSGDDHSAPEIGAVRGTPVVARDVLPQYQAHVEVLSAVVLLALPSEALLHAILDTLPGSRTDKPADFCVAVLSAGRKFKVMVDNDVAEQGLSPREIIPQTLSVLFASAINREDFAGCLHCAAIGTPAGVMLIPGVSGRGKTCLSLVLAAQGYTWLCDDLTLMQGPPWQVRPVPAPACIKSTAWNAMAPHIPGLGRLRTHVRVDGKRVKYRPLPSGNSADRAHTVKAIVFPNYQRTAFAQLETVERVDALEALLGGAIAWRHKLSGQSFSGIARWLEAIPCHRLTYSKGRDAAALVSELLPLPQHSPA
ncbi:MAG: hypothetical protein AAGG45_04590 [Pseudomonadota bacterium]